MNRLKEKRARVAITGRNPDVAQALMPAKGELRSPAMA
jgi:hypothetical protein